MSLRTKLFKWLTHGQLHVNEPMPKPYASITSMVANPVIATSATDAEMNFDQPSIALRFIKASNGNVIEVTSTTKNKHGHFDRAVETYVVTEDQKLSEVILQILAIKALEK
jgi:hypothetical protein